MNQQADTAARAEDPRKNRQGFLIFALIAAFALYMWQAESGRTVAELLIPNAEQGTAFSPASHTGIDELELLDVNFWEAQVQLTYSLEKRHGKGYVALYMSEAGGHSTVGLRTTPGQSRGIALLSRNSFRPSGYHVSKVRAQMYDPYRRDRNYYDEDLDLNIDWPDAESLGVTATANSEVFYGVEEIAVYRNVPSYVEFAQRLVEEGAPPDVIDLRLAVCGGCPGSIIFGEGVPAAAVQSVIRALASHNFPLDRIEYSQLDRHEGTIHIGQTPTDASKSFWSIHEAVVAEDVGHDEFFELIGFEQPPAHEQAVALHRRAKALIDYAGRNKDLERAGVLLDRALTLDSAYIPIYLEKARRLTRIGRGFSAREPSASALESITLLKNALKIDPDYADTYVLLGYYQTAMHRYDEAMASFVSAETLESDNLWLYANRSIWHELNGQPELAVQDLERVTEHELDESNNDRALNWALQALPSYYIDVKRYAEAQMVYERLREDFPNVTSVLRAYAYFLATYTDQYTRLNEVVANSCRTCGTQAKELEALVVIVDAARKASEDKPASVRMLVQAQSSGLSLSSITAQFSKGGSGRLLLAELVPQVVTMGEIEEGGSTLLPLLHPSAVEARAFLLSLGANPNHFDPLSGVSPLMMAVAMKNVELVQELMEHGGDPGVTNSDGLSALLWAQELDNAELLALLVTEEV
jgi:tetratricopeptide (TPR) repeat protein